MKRLLVILFFVFICLGVNSQNNSSLTRILFVFDASQSMYSKWESDTRINIAKRMLSQMLDSLKCVDNLEVAIRVYGHQKPVPPQDCSDTRLEVPFRKNNIDEIKSVIQKIEPKGTTPIARSLEAAALDFPKSTPSRNIIILITDGIEACDGDPCAVSIELQKQGIILKPFVIGIGLDADFKKTFECVGQYFDASSEKQFKDVMGIVISQALNNTTLQVNLLDINENPTETDVPITFYEKNTGKIIYNFVHTLNNKGNPDTLVLDPLMTYKMIAHTIPPVSIDSIKLTPGKHTVVGTNAAQGFLTVKANIQYFKETKCLIRQKNNSLILHVQGINELSKLMIGNYDLEILSLPRLYINDVNIRPNHTTTVQIPNPGMVTLMFDAPGIGSILLEKDNKLEWVVNLDPESTRQTFVLLPGSYRVVWRSKNIKKTVYSIEKKFTIKSDTSIPIIVK
ncbi:MAG TPA: VWA domain-containing protein [Bacteroidales bacterium]|jgi:Ca-activated chloride channel family protein|nr:VWA domain-containing protein [Bacteroidales bacterium]HNV96590.1 VWA domain-containing protein [Bacteroidales bacterium]